MLESIAFGNYMYFAYAIPFVLYALYAVWRSSRHTVTAKILLTLTYTLLFASLAAILAQVSIETYIPQQEQGSLTVLIDNSTSMSYHELDIAALIDSIPLKVTKKIVATESTSPLNTKISSSLYTDGNFLLITDGYATDGDDLTKISQTAQSLDATLHTLDLDAFKNDASVRILGPQKTFVGTANSYVVQILGNDKVGGTLKVFLDGEESYSSTDLSIDHPVTFTFADQQTHTISAKIETNDLIQQNNEFYLTTRIIPKPKVLTIGSNNQIEHFAKDIFDVTAVSKVPQDTEPYSAIIMHNARLQNIDATPIESFVSEGGGLVVFGGNDAFEYGKYDSHNLASMLPVKKGRSGAKAKATIVIALDISASTEAEFSQISATKAIEIQKAIAYSIVEQLGDDNVVGIVAFNTEAFVVSDLVPLSISRKTVLDKITRIQMQGNTRINVGLGAAHKLLENEVGTSAIVLISDGLAGGDSDGPKTVSVAKKLKKEGIKLFSVGVGSHINDGLLRQIALETDGLFLSPGETDRLAIQFGQVKDSLQQKPTFSFIISNFNHPITFGLDHPTTQLNNVNQVVPKAGAQVLVKSTQGDPALTIWNYGLGRVGTWTAFEGISDQKNFVNSDSYLFSRLLTWGAGDPELKNPPLFVIDDTTLGAKAKVTANAPSLERLAEILNTTVEDLAKFNLEKIDESQFVGEILSRNIGFTSYYGQTFATNYAAELELVGQSPAVSTLSRITGGVVLKPQELQDFAITVNSKTEKIKTLKSIQRELSIAALILLIIHIIIGKIVTANKRRKDKTK